MVLCALQVIGTEKMAYICLHFNALSAPKPLLQTGTVPIRLSIGTVDACG
jgi:hypothetical protein